MQQTAHRHSLGATPIRPSVGVPLRSNLGLTPSSRVQPTGYLINHYGHGVQGLNSPSSGLGLTPSSRVQPTGYLLHHFGQGAPPNHHAAARSSAALDAAAKAGMAGAATAAITKGLGVVGASWLTQGVILAASAEFIRKFFDEPKSEIEKEAELVEAARKVNDPFVQAGLVGNDRFIVAQSHLAGMGQRGLGSATGTMATGLTAATTITSAAIQSGTAIGSSSTWLAAAGGPIGIGVAGVTIALAYLWGRQRPQRKVATTQIVDEVEPLLQQNLADYMAGPRTVSSQAQAMANFDAGWQFVVDNCGIPDMGEPGKWCINDRKRGGRWDWFARYLDPIANDTQVVPDPGPDYTTSIDPVTGERVFIESPSSVGNMMPLLIALGLGAAALMIGGSK